MLPKSKIKVVQSLKHKKNRINSNLFIVEGIKSFDELLKSNYKIEFTIISKETLDENKYYKNLNDLYVVSAIEIKKLSGLKNNKSLISVAHKKNQKKESIDFSKLIIALDSVSDPGNLGTIIRIADWFNIKSIICSKNTVDLYNSKVIQSSMGSFTRVNVFYENLKEIISNKDINVIGTSTDGIDINKFELPDKGIILFGNEAKGIHKDLKTYIDRWISIKKNGRAESLNVSVSVGIILHKLTQE